MRLRFLFVHMSHHFGADVPYGYDFRRKELRTNRRPSSARMWGADLAEALVQRGHTATYACLEKPEFMQGWFGEPVRTWTLDSELQVFFAAELEAVAELLSAADVLVLRHDYARYRPLVERAAPRGLPTFMLLAGPFPIAYRPEGVPFVLFVNSEEERARYADRGIRSEVFLKPARRIFFEAPPREKTWDIVQVLWNTGAAYKRFPLLLDALPELDGLVQREVTVAVVGDSSAHAAAIKSLRGRLERVRLHAPGPVHLDSVHECFQAARVSVVTSQLDANPQVISESIASGVPVACARDLSGGRFQIVPEVGELFDPEPRALARTLADMLAHLGRYRPRDHAIDPTKSARQLEEVLATL